MQVDHERLFEGGAVLSPQDHAAAGGHDGRWQEAKCLAECLPFEIAKGALALVGEQAANGGARLSLDDSIEIDEGTLKPLGETESNSLLACSS